jgi:hypothetical protein
VAETELMKSKLLIRDWIIGLFLALAGFTAAKLAVQATHVRAQANVTPFTLHLNFYRHPERAAPDLYAQEVTARKPDGITVTKRTIGPVRRNLWFRKLTRTDGVEILAHDSIGVKTTFHLPAKEAAAKRDRVFNPPGNCLYNGFTLVRVDLVLGHRVSVVREETSYMRTTRWLADDLGCEQLRYTEETKDANGQWRVVIEAQAVKLEFGDPDPALFEVATGLKEAKPSDATRVYNALFGIQEDEKSKRSAEALDGEYLRQTEQR